MVVVRLYLHPTGLRWSVMPVLSHEVTETESEYLYGISPWGLRHVPKGLTLVRDLASTFVQVGLPVEPDAELAEHIRNMMRTMLEQELTKQHDEFNEVYEAHMKIIKEDVQI